MDLRFTPEEIAFRQEVRDFIRENLPADIHAKMKLGNGPSKEDTVRWQRILNAKGWAGLDGDPEDDLSRRKPDGARAGAVLVQHHDDRSGSVAVRHRGAEEAL